MMYTYKERDNLIYKINSRTSISYILLLVLFSLVFSHPCFLVGLLLAIGVVIGAAGIVKEWIVYLKVSLGFIVIITLVNCIFVKAGQTVLLWGPYIPGLGKMRVSLESLCYAVGMGIRFLVIVSAFCLFNCAVHPDKILKILGKSGNKVILALSLSTRLFPVMMGDFHRIKEVQCCRGVNFQEKKLWRKAKKYIPIMNIMLISGLERSFQLAEAMEARGYGLKGRSYYSTELWRPRDFLIFIALGIASVLGTWLMISGVTNYEYYPLLNDISGKDALEAGIFSLLLMIPAILNWGWSKWPLLRSKI